MVVFQERLRQISKLFFRKPPGGFFYQKQIRPLQPSRDILVQSQQWKHQSNVWNLFKVNNKDTRTSMTLNRFHSLFWCFYYWLPAGKWWFNTDYYVRALLHLIGHKIKGPVWKFITFLKWQIFFHRKTNIYKA